MSSRTALRAALAAERGRLVALLADLVRAGSVNPPGDVTAPARVAADFLRAEGLAVETVAARPDKPNLVVAVEGARPGPHLVLNGHLDTVLPGEESAWTVPIHELTSVDGRLHGLGAGNMKGAVAALLIAFAHLARARDRLAGRVTLTLVADETVFGPDGAAFLLEERPELLGDALICGEGPGSMNLAVAEKGLFWFRLHASGRAGQGMLTTRGSSAIARLAAALVELDSWNDIHAEPPCEIAGVAASGVPEGLRLSANIGTIQGGGFVSQAASEASAEVDVRIPPGLTLADIERRLEALVRAHPGLAFEAIKGWDPNWTVEDAGIAAAVRAAAAEVRGRPPAPVVRLPASDASRWRARGVPAVCYGPQPTLAAGVDDHVNERDLADCAGIYALAALAYLNGAVR